MRRTPQLVQKRSEEGSSNVSLTDPSCRLQLWSCWLRHRFCTSSTWQSCDRYSSHLCPRSPRHTGHVLCPAFGFSGLESKEEKTAVFSTLTHDMDRSSVSHQTPSASMASTPCGRSIRAASTRHIGTRFLTTTGKNMYTVEHPPLPVNPAKVSVRSPSRQGPVHVLDSRIQGTFPSEAHDLQRVFKVVYPLVVVG